MSTITTRKEEQNKRKGFLVSVLIHTALLALMILPLLTYPDPPPGQEGILVNLGADFGQGEENAPEPTSEVAEPVEEEPVEETQEQEPQEEVVEETEPAPAPEKEVVETEDPDAIALKRKKEEERKRQEDLKRQRELEEKRRQEEEARRKAEEEAKQKKYEETKSKYSGVFGGGDGEGKGNTGESGNQGSKDGDPDASKLEGVSTGTGQVGGGLGSRGVRSAPRVTDSSQKTGTVVLKVCVNASGDVISAEWTQAGSTTTDSRLRTIAIANAKNWKFSASNQDKQCGTIKYEFKVK